MINTFEKVKITAWNNSYYVMHYITLNEYKLYRMFCLFLRPQ